MTALLQSPNHVRAHAPEADHPKLHKRRVLSSEPV